VSRRWLELSVRCPSVEESIPLLAEGLVDLGGRAAVEQDGWCVTHVSKPDDPEAFVRGVRNALVARTGFTDLEVRTRWQAHEDWAETWKRGLAPRRITDRLVVRPSWTDFRTGGSGHRIGSGDGVWYCGAWHDARMLETARPCRNTG